jgi:hypothetical protein
MDDELRQEVVLFIGACSGGAKLRQLDDNQVMMEWRKR